jgi:hypothetical protein
LSRSWTSSAIDSMRSIPYETMTSMMEITVVRNDCHVVFTTIS